MKTKNRRRNFPQKFFFSEKELDIAEENMTALGITNKSEYFRDMILNGKKIVVNFDYENLNKLVYELNKIGTNINQIARVTNERKNIFHPEVEELQNLLQKMNELISSEFKKVADEINELDGPTLEELLDNTLEKVQE